MALLLMCVWGRTVFPLSLSSYLSVLLLNVELHKESLQDFLPLLPYVNKNMTLTSIKIKHVTYPVLYHPVICMFN